MFLFYVPLLKWRRPPQKVGGPLCTCINSLVVLNLVPAFGDMRIRVHRLFCIHTQTGAMVAVSRLICHGKKAVGTVALTLVSRLFQEFFDDLGEFNTCQEQSKASDNFIARL